MSILEQAEAHFDGIGRRSISVPEWGKEGKPAVITWMPMTVLQQRAVLAGKDPGPELKVDVLILKAQDENGNKLFSEMDKHRLMTKVDPAVVDRIATAILKAPNVDETEKN
jgi:hypothetical protein